MEKEELVRKFKDNYAKVKDKAADAARKAGKKPEEITIVAVSKTHPFEYIEAGIEAGISDFGENYAQELRDKHAVEKERGIKVPAWHFIGHLQRNKAKYAAPCAKMIHTVDSEKLIKELEKQAKRFDRESIDALLQINTSGEKAKSGIEPEDAAKLTEAVIQNEVVKIRGLMTIGTFSQDEKIIRKEFSTLRKVFEELSQKFPEADLTELSMGMSHDFHIAIDEGATIVRVGTAIFGERDYNN